MRCWRCEAGFACVWSGVCNRANALFGRTAGCVGSENYLGEEGPMGELRITCLRRTVFSLAGRAISEHPLCGGVALVAGTEDALGPACALVVVVELCVAAFVRVRERCGWRRRVVARAVECVGRCSRRNCSTRSVYACINCSAAGWAVRSELGVVTGECGV